MKVFKKLDNLLIDKLSINDLNNFGLSTENYSTRLKIDTGFKCNAKCKYCYYLTKVNNPDFSKEDIIKQIDKAVEKGFQSIEFSGGESTIHPDFIEFVKYAKSKGLITSVITNGSFNEDLLLKVNGYLDEIMFSIHGNSNTHDNILKIPNAYQTIFKHINFIKTNYINTRIRFNVIINNKSIFELEEFVPKIIKSSPSQINFLPINEFSDAKSIGKRQQSIIHDNINLLEQSIDFINKQELSTDINIRYFEFCKIDTKYHKYLKNYLHHYFENDWNPFYTYKREIMNIKDNCIFTEDVFKKIKNNLKDNRSTQYYKIKECFKCNFNKVCDGFKN